ncbi:DUF421 domain-containing protein [Spirosoma utsteinense]|uniref:Membrane protein YcaP (DUF421 family) n=1 Tax=Spirosoma utsteinense TaxID=2585773 RepID=A0ABR6W6I4_9BACT|nr:YetF domain-containing protein [Spirosoma utsteinense]MBC3787885.1 putative membrane protein YcaP (DUF421 family) [Spirosoma utsteinense]MBC3792194.1 putative membrane protein YcaP (DUF421 family) [Spirosoma utsteinense]
MKKDEIRLDDWQRILFGDAPVEFLFEVLVRTALIYLTLLIMMRLLGKRMNGQLTNLELSVMLTMGAIMAPPMQIPDRGLLSGTLGLLCALAFLRGSNLLGFVSKKAEKLIHGTETILIREGIIQLDEMARNRLSRQQIFAALRSENVYHLGKVKRLYLEAYGIFSIYEEKQDKPGLTVMPPADETIRTTYQKKDDHTLACGHCGKTVPTSPEPGDCPVCTHRQWEPAVC